MRRGSFPTSSAILREYGVQVAAAAQGHLYLQKIPIQRQRSSITTRGAVSSSMGKKAEQG